MGCETKLNYYQLTIMIVFRVLNRLLIISFEFLEGIYWILRINGRKIYKKING
jgi:hypothetical protein